MTTERNVLPSPDEVAAARTQALAILDGLDRTLYGQKQLTRMVLVGALARGHVLLEGLPGLGKTELVKALATLLGLSFKRLQFTPDLLPGDVTGGHMLEEENGRRKLVFHPGPVFTNVLLADEINRASPKTQSALLEAMQERRVTVLGETRTLPQPFWVLATQNPIELEGTYPLPEAQLDRFLFKVEVQGVGREALQAILMERSWGQPPQHAPVADAAALEKLFGVIERIHLPKSVAAYIARIVDATHPRSDLAPDNVKKYVRYGASPRAAIAIAEAGRAHALLAGKPSVGFDDVRTVAASALGHRLVLDYRARLDGIGGGDAARSVLESVGEIEEALPREVTGAR